MTLGDNPIYRLESRGRGPTQWNDLVGLLVGRGWLSCICRLLPVVAVMGSIAISRVLYRNLYGQASLEFALWSVILILSSLFVLMGSALSAGHDWQAGRMNEWLSIPMERSALVGGKVWGWALPAFVALAVGSALAAAIWCIGWNTGFAIPFFAPLEGVLVICDTWAAVFMSANIGVWAGNLTRKGWLALVVATLVAIPLLIAMLFGIILSVDHALLGGHLSAIGGAWLAGSLFQGMSERLVRWSK